ncbi:PREDICTED: uncharacterized protein LOC109171110 [Ipomoea nil]|uniref:uncharacterized protein LOC109171110 n=1 Tax=Ipomoea nil TaxID=35883 RepID=UPI000900FF7D|nr:PREDICTED: uncharacterized protein LOC109171110 [Ipomoea nil]
MVSKRGIEPNPEKVKAILEMEPPRSLREVQRLNGRLAALGRFLSRSAERSLPFFGVLKKNQGFEWSDECQKAFEDLKTYLMTLPPLAKPEKGEVLYLYLGISQATISSVLVRDDAGTQRPVYYVSRALRGAELRYSPTEKAIFAVDATAKKLGHYFQAHPVRVLTNQPLEAVLRASGSASRLVKWSIRLSQYDVQFKPRPAIKGQALADFIVECTAREAAELARSDEEDWWTLSTDGSSGLKGCGGGVVLVTPEGFRAYNALRFHFKLSNNEAEYEALLGGLRLALGLRASKIRVRCDSRLVVGQVNGEFEANEERMRRYRDVVVQVLGQLTLYEILQEFKAFCDQWYIKHTRVVVAYPQANGQVENANRTIIDGIKKNLDAAGGTWVEELDTVLWAYRTTPRRATGETPFALAYGFEARAPTEAVIPSYRVAVYDPDLNEQHHAADLHLIDDRREEAMARAENYQRQTKAYHDSRVRPRYFQVGDYVLRRREASRPQDGGKFATKWEGPYVIEAIVRPGSYKLRTTSGKVVDRVWNSEHLLKFYQ